MKLEIEEVAFVKSAFDNVTIKASDAPGVAKIIDKLDREFVRLQKLQEAKDPNKWIEELSKFTHEDLVAAKGLGVKIQAITQLPRTMLYVPQGWVLAESVRTAPPSFNAALRHRGPLAQCSACPVWRRQLVFRCGNVDATVADDAPEHDEMEAASPSSVWSITELASSQESLHDVELGVGGGADVGTVDAAPSG